MNHNDSIVDPNTDDENEKLNLGMLAQFSPIQHGLYLEFTLKMS
jgi:hypothetical protein